MYRGMNIDRRILIWGTREVRNKEVNRNKRDFMIEALRLLISDESVGKVDMNGVSLSQYLDIWIKLVCPENLTLGIVA